MLRIIVDLRDGLSVLSSKSLGEGYRAENKLDILDEVNHPVEVIIAPETFSVTPSFFIGMFGKSILKAGSREKFLEKYQFSYIGEHITVCIEEGIERVLRFPGGVQSAFVKEPARKNPIRCLADLFGFKYKD